MRALAIFAVLGLGAMAARAASPEPAQAGAWAGGLDAPAQLPGFGFTLDLWGDGSTDAGPAWAGGLETPGDPLPSFDLGFDAFTLMSQDTERGQALQAIDAPDTSGDNVRAFLAAIAWAEGTERAADPYRVCYGYRHTIQDLSEHPAITGEWRGEPLDSLGAAYRGKISTAAGRYQIIRPTWARARQALGLRDFGAASQDAAAVWLIKQRRALDLVQAGQVEDAIARCAAEWASLPGSGAGQPQRRMAQLIDTYSQQGGNLA